MWTVLLAGLWLHLPCPRVLVTPNFDTLASLALPISAFSSSVSRPSSFVSVAQIPWWGGGGELAGHYAWNVNMHFPSIFCNVI
ncbi:hypothetical protein HPP92_019766 [Vanilla planifolia]|uniref:Secreted protein n=1 Tax=Vanilla planifolia TaxID=51239 RepID=A0A835Q6C5_VANPL|nr:hypothetical protein HPP92_019766 [Vanilla planifolia]